MTDELSPEQEAAVRRLLAQARHDQPVPAEVAAHLDEVLEGLVADEGVDDLEVFESGGAGSVTALAGVRHRRRKAGRLLLAAAAVVVGGVAIGQDLGTTGLSGSGDDLDSADAGGDQAALPRESTSRDQEESESALGDSPDLAAPSAPTSALSGAGQLLLESAPVSLSSRDFAADVRRELKRTADERRNAALSDFDGVSAYASANGGFACATGAYGEGAKLPAYYDEEEAVLVLRRPRAGIQRVDLLTCGTAVQLNSVDLPAP